MGFFSYAKIAAPIVASVAGGLINNKGSKGAAADANAFTTEQLQNRHQWEVDDLRKAGLNPVLSAGGTPSIGGSSTADYSEPIAGSVSTALQSMQLRETINNIREDTELKKRQQSATDANARNQDAQAAAAASTAALTNTTNIQKGALTPLYQVLRGGTNSAKSRLDDNVSQWRNLFKNGLPKENIDAIKRSWGF